MSAGPAWTPPAGWIPLPSAVEGVELFGPAPTAEATPAGPVAVRCPSCGASARFDVAKGAVGCGFCGWVDAEGPEVVGRKAAQGEFTPEALQRGAQGLGVDRRELACGGCGAVIALGEGALSVTCPFCASNQVSVREHATVEGLRPSALVPFSVLEADCGRLAGGWLGQGWFHPDDLARLSRVGSFVPIYLPYWAFSARIGADWEGEVGTNETVREWNSDEKRWETTTRIRWEWKRGSVRLDLRDLLVPGTTKVSNRLLERVQGGFDLDGLVTYEPKLLAGFQATTYDVGLPDGWERGRHALRERARAACERDAGGDHLRSFSMTADLDDESWRHLLLPVWVSAYRYAGRTWVVLVDGQRGTIAGQKPIAWWKVWTAVGLALTPGVCSGLLGIPLLLVGGLGGFLLILALVLLVLGGVGSVSIYQHAVESEAA